MINNVHSIASYQALSPLRRPAAAAIDQERSTVNTTTPLSAQQPATTQRNTTNVESLQGYAQRSPTARFQGPAFHFSKGVDGFYQWAELAGTGSQHQPANPQFNEQRIASQQSKMALEIRSALPSDRRAESTERELPNTLKTYQRIEHNLPAPGTLLSQNI